MSVGLLAANTSSVPCGHGSFSYRCTSAWNSATTIDKILVWMYNPFQNFCTLRLMSDPQKEVRRAHHRSPGHLVLFETLCRSREEVEGCVFGTVSWRNLYDEISVVSPLARKGNEAVRGRPRRGV